MVDLANTLLARSMALRQQRMQMEHQRLMQERQIQQQQQQQRAQMMMQTAGQIGKIQDAAAKRRMDEAKLRGELAAAKQQPTPQFEQQQYQPYAEAGALGQQLAQQKAKQEQEKAYIQQQLFQQQAAAQQALAQKRTQEAKTIEELFPQRQEKLEAEIGEIKTRTIRNKEQAKKFRQDAARALTAQDKSAFERVPAEQSKDIAQFVAAQRMLKTAADEFSKIAGRNIVDAIGTGIVSTIKETEPKKYERLRKIVAQTVGRILEGGKLTDPDYERHKASLASSSDKLETGLQIMQEIQNNLKTTRDATIDIWGVTGYDASPFKKYLEAVDTETDIIKNAEQNPTLTVQQTALSETYKDQPDLLNILKRIPGV